MILMAGAISTQCQLEQMDTVATGRTKMPVNRAMNFHNMSDAVRGKHRNINSYSVETTKEYNGEWEARITKGKLIIECSRFEKEAAFQIADACLMYAEDNRW